MRLPVIQAPMAGVQDRRLAAAVSNVGGLGSLPCAMLDPEALQRELADLSALTSQPYAVNFFCHVPPTVDETRERVWRQRLSPYYAELNIDHTDGVQASSTRRPFDHVAADVI